MSTGTGMGMGMGMGGGAGAVPGTGSGSGSGTGTAVGLDGRIRVALAAWLATLAAAAALLPLVESGEWLAQASLLLGCQTATGLVVRWRGAPGGFVVAAQALVSLLLVTMVSVPEYAVAGVLPGPEALDRLGWLLSSGADDVSHYVAPAPVTDGIRLMLLGGVLCVGLLVDVLAVTLRGAAGAGLPLLALYSVAAGVNEDGTSWPYFLCAAAGYLLLLLAEGRDRLTRWGRFFAGPGAAVPPQPPYPGAPPPPPPPVLRGAGPRVRTGRRIGAVTLGVATLVPMLLPALDEGLLGLDGEGQGRGGLGQSISVNPAVALHDQLNQPDDRTVLRYRTNSPEPAELYLRLVALDAFDGAEWSTSRWHREDVPVPPWNVPGLSDEVARTAVTTTIEASADYEQSSLPVPYPATGVQPLDGWEFDLGSQTLVSGESGQNTGGLSYQVEHLLVKPTPEQLAGAPAPSEDLLAHFTEVPDNLPGEVHDTAASITAQAANDYERAVELQRWFTQTGGFRYDTSVESGNGSQAIVRFLEEKEGFCVHFAFTMAAMARTLGIPAQVAVGFTPGDARAGGYEVGIHGAHAWPELYFEGVGWVRFEPTPGQGSAPSYTVPERTEPDPEQTGPEQSAVPESADPASPTPTPTATRSGGCDPALEPGACRTQGQTPESDDENLSLPVWPMIYGGGGLLLAGLLASPLLWRRRLRARRLAGSVSALPVWRELTETAWDFGVSPVASETPRQAALRIVRVTGLPEEPAAAVHRVAEAVERELYAPPGGPGDAELPRRGGGPLAADVRAASAALRAGSSRGARLRALLLPRSAVRVIHAVTDRRVRAAQRLTDTLQRIPRRRRA